jgi:hypothetical protein
VSMNATWLKPLITASTFPKLHFNAPSISYLAIGNRRRVVAHVC